MGKKRAKQIVQKITNSYKVNRNGYPYELIHRIAQLYQVIENLYSGSSITELQETIDTIGSGAGTIFIASGTSDVGTTIDIDGCSSYVIYGHGNLYGK
jgi:hypothetical protein